jgi:hypothetical protein
MSRESGGRFFLFDLGDIYSEHAGPTRTGTLTTTDNAKRHFSEGAAERHREITGVKLRPRGYANFKSEIMFKKASVDRRRAR